MCTSVWSLAFAPSVDSAVMTVIKLQAKGVLPGADGIHTLPPRVFIALTNEIRGKTYEEHATSSTS